MWSYEQEVIVGLRNADVIFCPRCGERHAYWQACYPVSDVRARLAGRLAVMLLGAMYGDDAERIRSERARAFDFFFTGPESEDDLRWLAENLATSEGSALLRLIVEEYKEWGDV